MKSKTGSKAWIIGFFLIILIGCLSYMYVCFHANPLGYFTNELGIEWYSSDDYTRSIKAKYILAHKDEIEGVIIGGSKAGALDVDLLEEYTGHKYYNMYFNSGNFSDYLAYTRFLVEQTNVKEITVHLSSFEAKSFSRAYRGNNFELPAVVTSGKVGQALEFLKYLMTDYKTMMKARESRPKTIVKNRDLLSDGMRNRRRVTLKFMKDPDAYVTYLLRDFDECMERLFSEYAAYTYDNYALNLNALREMKQICDEKGVALKLMIGASFLNDHFQYEWSGYYNYMADLVGIMGEVWDFSDYNDINMNPYNFYDRKHYSRTVSNLMIRTMYGADKREGFGILLTNDNIYEYLEKRKADYHALKEEYETTGTVQLQGMEDDSFLPWEPAPTWDMSEDGVEPDDPEENEASGDENDEG